jgi:hypothetical protein
MADYQQTKGSDLITLVNILNKYPELRIGQFIATAMESETTIQGLYVMTNEILLKRLKELSRVLELGGYDGAKG